MSARRLLTLLVFSTLLAACTLPGVSKAPQNTAPSTGGTYNVGDTGPGGGIVFYVHQNGTFASTGSDCGSSCKYLEAAPSDFIGGGVDVFEWCSDTESKFGVSATEIGTGMANTTSADAVCTSGAIQIAADYSNNGKTDWHLPSIIELNELCKYAGQETTGGLNVACTAEGSLRTGFSADGYWSSSVYSATAAWGEYFYFGTQHDTSESSTARVRPVRAF
jgi:hypothetical protein